MALRGGPGGQAPFGALSRTVKCQVKSSQVKLREYPDSSRPRSVTNECRSLVRCAGGDGGAKVASLNIDKLSMRIPDGWEEAAVEAMARLTAHVSVANILLAVSICAFSAAFFVHTQTCRQTTMTQPLSQKRPCRSPQSRSRKADADDSPWIGSDDSDDSPWISVLHPRKNEARYKFQETARINDEGTARVYRGLDARTGRVVCIKVALKAGGQLYNDRMKWRLLQDTGGWPGLPTLFDHFNTFGSDGSEEVLVSELCGPSLSSCVKRRADRRMSTTESCAVGLEMLRHLENMHHAGLCHRDVTLANFLLPRQPPVASAAPDSAPPSLLYVIDFGLSERFPARNNAVQDCSGTLRFATPYLGNAPLGPRDDLLSLGFVLLACLAGSLPWDDEACRACKAAQAKKQRSATAEAKLALLRGGAGTLRAMLEPHQAAFLDAFFGAIKEIEPQDAPPYATLRDTLTRAGQTAARRSREPFPPLSLCGLLRERVV